jgi:hypothetical protein
MIAQPLLFGFGIFGFIVGYYAMESFLDIYNRSGRKR